MKDDFWESLYSATQSHMLVVDADVVLLLIDANARVEACDSPSLVGAGPASREDNNGF